MTSTEIRQSFLDFFKEKEHTIVPSASLMPTSPNLLFTNAGMNQFVPYFLGTQNAPYAPPRAADTQKCIRAGGKHNDLEDVGYDTYHHTFFEMLGNWSFGNYFKKEAIEWAWELLVERWKMPAERLYATVYQPGAGDPADFDQEAHAIWKAIFEKAGLDPAVHIVNGGKKDNFWMMGETGPCGPCSEIHMDLTENGDSGGALVNNDSPRCIEIWNLVFIQYNAEEDGSFRALPACHVDTGMGFERACSVIQCTKGGTEFVELASNYNTDVFVPVFAALSALSGRNYGGTMPEPGQREGLSEEMQADVAFRVIADHLRTLSFSIADGILPGNTDRNYVLRRILRRAVRYGRGLGLGTDGTPFLSRLVPALVAQMGGVFPELAKRQAKVVEVLDQEETSFNRTLDRGIRLFNRELEVVRENGGTVFPGEAAFRLSDTYGFPIDLTQLMAAEQGLAVDLEEFETELQKQKDRGGATGETIRAVGVTSDIRTEFTGYDEDETAARIADTLEDDGKTYLIVDKCPMYVEMGGQVGDSGYLHANGEEIPVKHVHRIADAIALEVDHVPANYKGEPLGVTLHLDRPRRRAIESHHTATHLLHWALHRVAGSDVAQQGSFVGPDRLRFDFNSGALTKEQLAEIEQAVNERIAEDAPVSWTEVRHSEIKDRTDIMQFFGDKYGEAVRVVQIGGKPGSLDGYSMELCGGTHVRRTGEIGLFKIKSEGAIAAGIRRIEAVCGSCAEAYVEERRAAIEGEIDEICAKLDTANATLAAEGAEKIAVPVSKVAEGDIDQLAAHRDALKEAAIEAEKAVRKLQGAAAAKQADALMGALIDEGGSSIVANFDGDGGLLQELLNTLKKRQFAGVAVVTVTEDDKAHLGVYVPADKTETHQAGKLVQQLAPLIGGKGGGKPDMARGAGNDASGVGALLEKARKVLG